jgi:hypothetical protein
MCWNGWRVRVILNIRYSGSTEQVLAPFGIAVSDTFSTTAGEFCYTYSRSAIDDSVRIQCRSDWLQGWIKSLIPNGAVNVTAQVATTSRIATVHSINLVPP